LEGGFCDGRKAIWALPFIASPGALARVHSPSVRF
jgi:hypothetical protein